MKSNKNTKSLVCLNVLTFRSDTKYQFFKKIRFNIIIILTIIFLSPAIKYSKAVVISYSYFFDKPLYNNFYSTYDYGNNRANYLDITKYLNRTSQKDDKILIISNGANILSFFLSDYNQYPFSHSMFYLGKLRLEYYSKIFVKELQEADILILNTYDGHTQMSGNVESSFALIFKDVEYSSIINENFEDEVCFDNFIIYRRKANLPK